MGGGAFMSMIRVACFFVFIWGASKVSRMAGISSIVLEITTGLIFSPTILGLMPKEYAECVFKLHHDCDDIHTINHIQDHLQGCDYEAYMKTRNGVMLLPEAVEIPADAHGGSGHGDDGHATDDSHSGSASGDDTSSSSGSTDMTGGSTGGSTDMTAGSSSGDHSSGDHGSTDGDHGSTDSHSSTGGDHSGGDHGSTDSHTGGDHSGSTDSHSGDDHSSSNSDHASSNDHSGDDHGSTDSHSDHSGSSGSHSGSDHGDHRRLDNFAETRKKAFTPNHRRPDIFAETRKKTFVPNSPLARQSRRLSGDAEGVTKYGDYSECLEKACLLDVSHECQLTPDIFTFVGHAGVALMIFESGMHFDFEKAKVVGKWACVVAVLGTILPLITGTLLVVLLIPGSDLTTDGLSAGTALAPTSVGIALKLLNEAKQLQKDFGQIIITAAFVDDILSLVLFNVLFSMADGELGFMTFFPAMCGLALMGIVIVYAATRADRDIETILNLMPDDPPKKKLSYKDEFLFFIMMIMVLVFGTVFFFTGTHLWGCFMAGMCLAKLHSAHHVWVKQTKRMTVWMIRIFFSCTVAFSIPVSALLSFGAIWKGAIMGIGPCIATKVFCAFFMGEMRFVVGWAMVGRAEFAYLIAQMAAASNMMTEEVFAVVIWSLLWATIFAPFLFRYVLKQFVAMNEARRREEMGDKYFPEDEEDDGHGHGHDDEFRQSGHLPLISDMYPDFMSQKYDGLKYGYHFIKNGPKGSGYYKDFLPRAQQETQDAYEYVENGGSGPGLYLLQEFHQDGELDFKFYKKAPNESVHVHHEEKSSNEKAEKPVTSSMEEDPVVEKHDMHTSFKGKDSDEASDVAADRGSGFLCCLFFRKIVIM